MADLSLVIAAELGPSHDLQAGLRVMGELHDVGKIGIPAEILAKRRRLNSAELEFAINHARRGYGILKMGSYRPYRAGLGLDVALREVEKGAGTALGAAAVKACIKVFRVSGFQELNAV